MFAAQPSIGQDMAAERREAAARIRRSVAGGTSRRRRRIRHGRVDPTASDDRPIGWWTWLTAGSSNAAE